MTPRRWLPNAIAAAVLAVLAIASAVAWRVELEWQGWAGTAWTQREHHAFPLSMAAFVVWAVVTAWAVQRVPPWRVAILGALLAAIAVAGWILIPNALLFAFGGFGGGLISMDIAATPQHAVEIPGFLGKSHAGEVLMRDLLFWAAWLVPTVALWGALRAGGVRSPFWTVPISALIQFWAWPLSIWLLALLDHKGGADPEHALKTGFVIPWLVIAVGLPLVVAPSRRAAQTAPELVG